MAYSDSIKFDGKKYHSGVVQLDGKEVAYRGFENIVYVKNPVLAQNQCMNIYVPEAYFNGGSVNGYTAKTAPVFFPNMIGGFMPSQPGVLRPKSEKTPSAISYAILNGFVVASPGARGRSTMDQNKKYNGKAPAAIVDLKAAVRYLRYNKKRIPGDMERIISNGTSAGGAFSALLGTSGNSRLYEPYLKELGAAKERDDIFAASCYCPITNLEKASSAYEWQLKNVSEVSAIKVDMLDYKVQRKEEKGLLSDEQLELSKKLASIFPDYVNSLNLIDKDGRLLSLDKDGNGSFKDYVKSFVLESAKKEEAGGKDMSAYSFLKFKDGKIADLDFEGYVEYAGRMKTPGAFDAVDCTTGENNLFGDADNAKKYFTDFIYANRKADYPLASPEIVYMMNAMNFIGKSGAVLDTGKSDENGKSGEAGKTSTSDGFSEGAAGKDAFTVADNASSNGKTRNNDKTGGNGADNAKHFRIRHGTRDRDTSLAIPVILATRLENCEIDTDFSLPWDRPHSGDYDLPELFAWINGIVK